MIKRIICAYFTGTGTTKKVVETIGDEVKKNLEEREWFEKECCKAEEALESRRHIEKLSLDFSLPKDREEPLSFNEKDLVIFGMPVVAGRLPNLIIKELTIECGKTKVFPVVLYGNRDFQDALVELKDILLKADGVPIGGAAFIGEHSFSEILAKGRPDEKDLQVARVVGKKICDIVCGEEEFFDDWGKVGNAYPYFGYYKPRKQDGSEIDIRKVKPDTDERCIYCMKCVVECRMNAIAKDDPKNVKGICIKCCCCVKACPQKAKEFRDEDFIYHKNDLEKTYIKRQEPIVFI